MKVKILNSYFKLTKGLNEEQKEIHSIAEKFAKSNKKSSQISSEILQEWFYNRAV